MKQVEALGREEKTLWGGGGGGEAVRIVFGRVRNAILSLGGSYAGCSRVSLGSKFGSRLNRTASVV